ncbi:hypothetical protein F5Y10DRAFT_281480 [Nemania abortiva]|nr:hypothetical protein F5Y10DRAFT_281480 [Nemania abortiva]
MAHVALQSPALGCTIPPKSSAIIEPERTTNHGFIFHDACWRLFERVCLSRGVPAPLKRLFEILSSLPFVTVSRMEGKVINWGHDFDNWTPLDKKSDSHFPSVTHYFPWEKIPDIGSAYPGSTCFNNPLDTPEPNDILKQTPESPPKLIVTTYSDKEMEQDPFNKLPIELCLAIAMYLQTSDALNVRLDSRAFWPLFDDQQFWASRFAGEFDRAWFFEALESAQALDWRWLYHRTETSKVKYAELKHRRRIWNLFNTMFDTYVDLRWHDDSIIPTSQSPGPRSSHTLEVKGDLWEPESDGSYSFDHGCRLLYKRYVAIPTDLSKFSISYIKTPDTYYISVIKFTTVHGNITQLGYWSMASTEYSLSAANIWGFVIAFGAGGIQAVKCLTGRDTASQWLGCTEDNLKTRRLAAFDRPLDSLEVGFDGFKIVSLATANLPSKIPEKDKLRSLGLWYPDIPGPNLSLNEGSFLRRSDFWSGYKPLFWTHFGGPSGEYLKHLIGINLWWRQGALLRIEFKYNIEVPVEIQHFGRHPQDAHMASYEDPKINGPGGEIVKKIELEYHDDKSKPYPLEGVKIVTKRLDAERGTAITGLYAGQVLFPNPPVNGF